MKYQAIDSEYIREMKERDEFLKQKGYMLKGVKYGYFIAIIIIILSALFNGNLVLAIGEVDISYEFESDELYNETDFSEATNFNIRNQTEYTGHYNATYSFENETGLTGIDIPFVSAIQSDKRAEIVAEVDGHTEVINLTSVTTYDYLYNEFVNQEVGTIEYWYKWISDSPEFHISNDAEFLTDIKLYSGTVRMYHGVTYTDLVMGMDDWVHFKVLANCTSNTQSIWVNGILEIDNLNFIQNKVSDNFSRFYCSDAGSNGFSYLDAIGYSWDIDYETPNILDGTTFFYGAIESGSYSDVITRNGIYLTLVSTDNGGHEEIDTWLFFDLSTIGYLNIYLETSYDTTGDIIFEDDASNELISSSTNVLDIANSFISDDYAFFNLLIQDASTTTFYCYIDLLIMNASSGANYIIGDNLVPYSITNTSIQETNAYEFSFTEAGIYTESEATPPFWTEIESSTYVQDGYFRILDDTSATTDLGLYKDDFSITSGIIDVSMVFEYEHSSTEEAVFYLKLISADTTEIVRLRMYSHLFDANTINTLSYWNGTTYNNITTLVKDVIYSINVFINGRMVILSLDGVKISIFETLADKDGLSEVRFHGNGGQYGDGIGQNRYVDFKIYSIGVYSEGISVSNDYYSSFISTTLDWDSNEYNFFTADIVGNCSIVVGSTLAIGSPHTLFAYREFNGVEMKNVYDEFTGGNEVEGWVALQDFNLTITSNTTIILNSMEVSGFKLTEGLNTYYMDLTSSGIDVDNSYFYVLGGRLYFSLTTDDSNLEYMEATFVIPNIPSFERGLDWSGVKSGSSLEAQFKVNYIDSSFNPFTLTPAYKDLAVLLPQDKTITSFSLLISDNDNDINDTITGSIGSFDLIYIPLIETDFVSISFFDALPIVVLVVVIPIALYVGFGKKKELLVPSIIAMSIFGTAIGLIPLWLTFVIGFGCVSYFIMDRRR